MKIKKYYITAYAFTKGIVEVAEDSDTKIYQTAPYNEYVCIDRKSGACEMHLINRDIFESKADAIANAESRKKKRIASLKEQLERLEKLKFDKD